MVSLDRVDSNLLVNSQELAKSQDLLFRSPQIQELPLMLKLRGSATPVDERDAMKYGFIYLPYFKQGHDLAHCYKYDKDGKIDLIRTFRSHQRLLTGAIEKLDAIIGVLEDYPDARLELRGDTYD